MVVDSPANPLIPRSLCPLALFDMPNLTSPGETICQQGDMNDETESPSGEVEQPPDKKPIKYPSYRYAIFLTSFPRLSLFFAGLFLITSLGISLIFSEIPVFDDPAKEFVTIHTVSSARLDQLEALRQNLVPFPEKRLDFESACRKSRVVA
ncbi:unnamed protein product [Dibothriocephalus latus]|uniref:SSD domain-containing protein n=1 Tax=Dibothriocephalus latus TaxID=60516 RepID=A0A3P7NX97_DIBLA|nr:unnamed protein product [Dibothriocephalus latus]